VCQEHREKKKQPLSPLPRQKIKNKKRLLDLAEKGKPKDIAIT